MIVRKARPEDYPRVLRLAEDLDLDYEGMAADEFWVAEVRDEVVGIVGLIRHPDSLELVALGVLEKYRLRGIGEGLVEALLAEAAGDIHLATVIPGYFARLGFVKTSDIPASLTARKTVDWCRGCSHELCTVMVKRRP